MTLATDSPGPLMRDSLDIGTECQRTMRVAVISRSLYRGAVPGAKLS